MIKYVTSFPAFSPKPAILILSSQKATTGMISWTRAGLHGCHDTLTR